MSHSRREQIEELFDKASSLPASERNEFLKKNCDDEDIRLEVEKLLKFDELEGGGLSGQVDHQLLQPPSQLSPTQTSDAASTSSSSIDHGRFIPGTVLSRRYRIVGMLGKGGMGEVYRADDLELGQSVALKFLPEQMVRDPRALERFRTEVRLARQVSHPNVCRVYDIGQMDGLFFISMEYVDGEDLSQLLKRIGRFNPERAIELARQLCLGLQAAHENGVLHRDLKPSNIMIDGRGKLLITDFGLAEFSDQIRHDDIRSGTPAYMSPEQLAGREVTVQSDIYSLGIILHEIYTGKTVWQAESIAELFEIRKSGSVPDPASHIVDLHPVVQSTIQRCLEPDPTKRPESALAVIASLPGGNPLAAALGAGETPSPEMVAAAGDTTSVAPAFAKITLPAIIVLLVLVFLLSERSSKNNQKPIQHSLKC